MNNASEIKQNKNDNASTHKLTDDRLDSLLKEAGGRIHEQVNKDLDSKIDPNFKKNLWARLKVQDSHDRSFSENSKNVGRDNKTKFGFGAFKLPLSVAMSFGFLFFCTSFVFASYTAVPEVRRQINESVGIPVKSTIAIQSEPAGAKVFLDGNEIGTTPLIQRIDPGTRQIRLELSGYFSVSQDQIFEPEKRSDISIDLEQIPNPLSSFEERYIESGNITYLIPTDFDESQYNISYSANNITGENIIQAIDLPNNYETEASIEELNLRVNEFYNSLIAENILDSDNLFVEKKLELNKEKFISIGLELETQNFSEDILRAALLSLNTAQINDYDNYLLESDEVTYTNIGLDSLGSSVEVLTNPLVVDESANQIYRITEGEVNNYELIWDDITVISKSSQAVIFKQDSTGRIFYRDLSLIPSLGSVIELSNPNNFELELIDNRHGFTILNDSGKLSLILLGDNFELDRQLNIDNAFESVENNFEEIHSILFVEDDEGNSEVRMLFQNGQINDLILGDDEVVENNKVIASNVVVQLENYENYEFSQIEFIDSNTLLGVTEQTLIKFEIVESEDDTEISVEEIEISSLSGDSASTQTAGIFTMAFVCLQLVHTDIETASSYRVIVREVIGNEESSNQNIQLKNYQLDL